MAAQWSLGFWNNNKIAIRIAGNSLDSDLITLSLFDAYGNEHNQFVRESGESLASRCMGKLPRSWRNTITQQSASCDFVLDVTGLQPAKVDVRYNGKSVPWHRPQLALTNLRPNTTPEFDETFAFTATRHFDPETTLKISSQIISDTDNIHLYPSYYIAAFVVYSYKSIELSTDLIQDDLYRRAKDRCEAILPTLSEDSSARRDRTQMWLSFKSACWQVAAHNGELDAVKAICSELANFDFKAGTPRITYALNISIAALLLAASRLAEGNMASFRDLSNRVLELFRFSASLPPFRAVWLRELDITHRAATLALQLQEEIESRGTIQPATYQLLVDNVTRVSSERINDSIRRLIGF